MGVSQRDVTGRKHLHFEVVGHTGGLGSQADVARLRKVADGPSQGEGLLLGRYVGGMLQRWSGKRRCKGGPGWLPMAHGTQDPEHSLIGTPAALLVMGSLANQATTLLTACVLRLHVPSPPIDRELRLGR